MEKTDVEVVIVGGGPAGCSAAYTLAKAGKKVALIERGDFCGAKNMFGGAIYTSPTKEVFPDFEAEAPLERKLVRHSYTIMDEKSSINVDYKNDTNSQGYTVLRPKWDRWCAQKVQEAGAYVVPQTLVEGLLIENDKFVGIKTKDEEFRANITILCDGVNSLLARKYNLIKELDKKNVALCVKKTIGLPKEKIEDRFNLEENEGAAYTLVGGSMLDITGMGFLYTNQKSISIGLGISLDDLTKQNKKPYEFLEELEQHSAIRPLIKGGETIEYSAHLIPEGGYSYTSKLYFNGLMVAGDAAMLVNNVHWEGTNLAMISGKYAAQAATEALNKSDTSENSLELYQKMLEGSFVLKDMKSYKNVISTVEKNSKSFLGYYPRMMNEFFETFTAVDSIPKREKYREFIKQAIRERGLVQFTGDALKIARLAGDALL